MTFATDMQNIAGDLLQEFGQLIQISRVDEGTFVPSTGAVGSGSTTSFSGYGYPSPYTSREIDNINVLSTDINLTIRVAQEIKVGDVATFNDTDFRVMNVENINVQGTNIIYQVQLRA